MQIMSYANKDFYKNAVEEDADTIEKRKDASKKKEDKLEALQKEKLKLKQMLLKQIHLPDLGLTNQRYVKHN